MKKFTIALSLIFVSAFAMAQDPYVWEFDSVPDFFYFEGAVPDTVINGNMVVSASDSDLHFYSSNTDEDNLLQRKFSFWTLKTPEVLDLSNQNGAREATVDIWLKSDETCLVRYTLAGAHPVETEMGNHTDLTIDAQVGGSANAWLVEVEGDGEWHHFHWNFDGEFQDLFGSTSGQSLGPVDSTQIIGIRFAINPGWGESWAFSDGTLTTGDNTLYDQPFGFKFGEEGWEGSTLSINKIEFGNSHVATDENHEVISNTSAYPNPTSDFAHIDYTVASGAEVEVIVSNLLGEEIQRTSQFKAAGNHVETIDVTNFDNGMYIVSFNINGEPAKLEKIYKN